MASDKSWYVADVILRIAVEGDPRSVVHVNTLLVQSATPAAAYDAAVALDRDEEAAYLNPQEQRVTVTFLGLRHLDVIHDQLRHGTEIMFEERVGLDEAAVADLVRPRAELAVFRQVRRDPDVPDCTPAMVADAMRDAGYDLSNQGGHRPPTPPLQAGDRSAVAVKNVCDNGDR